MRRFAFPYSNATLLALTVIVITSSLFAYYVYTTVIELTRVPLDQHPTLYWQTMFVLVSPVLLALYVVLAMFYRRRMTLTVSDSVLSFDHWFMKTAAVSHSDVRRIQVSPGMGRNWVLIVEHASGRFKAPLSDAVEQPEGQRHKIRTEKSAETHPLVVCLREHFDEQLSVRAS